MGTPETVEPLEAAIGVLRTSSLPDRVGALDKAREPSKGTTMVEAIREENLLDIVHGQAMKWFYSVSRTSHLVF